MKRPYVFGWSVLLATVVMGCSQQTISSTSQSASAPAVATKAAYAENGKNFGAWITAEGAESYSAFLQAVQSRDSLEAKVVGTVEAVCQSKGCWMNISAEQPGQPAMKVQFKDYAFFVPKDIAGRKIVVQGIGYREVTSVEDLRHYAEDAGKSKEEIQKIVVPKEELKFMAVGVLLID